MSEITKVHAREVLDSRGKPTLQVEVWCKGKLTGSAMVPSGASTGSAEAWERRDGDPSRYEGQGVKTAVGLIHTKLQPALLGMNPTHQDEIDEVLLSLDPSPCKTTLGGNTLLAVSLAAAHAGAALKEIPLYRHLSESFLAEAKRRGDERLVHPCALPMPMTNMISGGKHAGGNLDFQDILIQPCGAPSYAEGLQWIVSVYRRLGKLLHDDGFESALVGDEGGYGPKLTSNEQAVEYVVRAIQAAGFIPGQEINIAIDVAASHFYRSGQYYLAAERGRALSSAGMIELLASWVERYPIASIEDGLAEDDWSGWQQLTRRLGYKVQIVGDDLFATNEQRVQQGIELGAANAVLIKVNQIGTLSETFRTVLTARAAGFRCVFSARSGETEDTTLADLAVALGGETIKIGSIVRSERLAKYNRLLVIAEDLQGNV
jgi:enolase